MWDGCSHQFLLGFFCPTKDRYFYVNYSECTLNGMHLIIENIRKLDQVFKIVNDTKENI
jgi:hypothetical protein